MKFRVLFVACLHLVMAQAETAKLADFVQGAIFLDNGTFWYLEGCDDSSCSESSNQCCPYNPDDFVKGKLVTIPDERPKKGELAVVQEIYIEDVPFSAYFVGQIEEEVKVLQVFEWSLGGKATLNTYTGYIEESSEEFFEESNKDVYKQFVCHLNNGAVLLPIYQKPGLVLQTGQSCYFGNASEVNVLVNKEDFSLNQIGVLPLVTGNTPLIKIVKEVREDVYLFEDGSFLKRMITEPEMILLDQKIPLQVELSESIKVSVHADISKTEESDPPTKTRYQFNFVFEGDTAFREALIPSNLKEGDTVFCYPIVDLPESDGFPLFQYIVKSLVNDLVVKQ